MRRAKPPPMETPDGGHRGAAKATPGLGKARQGSAEHGKTRRRCRVRHATALQLHRHGRSGGAARAAPRGCRSQLIQWRVVFVPLLAAPHVGFPTTYRARKAPRVALSTGMQRDRFCVLSSGGKGQRVGASG